MKNQIEKSDERRITKNDPALLTLNKMAEMLDPYDRQTQLRILIAACVALRLDAEAKAFMKMLSD